MVVVPVGCIWEGVKWPDLDGEKVGSVRHAESRIILLLWSKNTAVILPGKILDSPPMHQLPV